MISNILCITGYSDRSRIQIDPKSRLELYLTVTVLETDEEQDIWIRSQSQCLPVLLIFYFLFLFTRLGVEQDLESRLRLGHIYLVLTSSTFCNNCFRYIIGL